MLTPFKKLPTPPTLEATRFSVGDDEWVVFSWTEVEEAAASLLSSLLSPTERAIVPMLMEGASNAEIAKRRGTSVRTVANQVAHILKRLGVGSRYELVARLSSARSELP